MQTIEDILDNHERELLQDYSSIMEFIASDVFLNKYIADIYGFAEHRYADIIKTAVRESFQRFDGMWVITETPTRLVQIRLANDLRMLYNYGDHKCAIMFDLYVDGKWAGRRFINRLYVIEDEET